MIIQPVPIIQRERGVIRLPEKQIAPERYPGEREIVSVRCMPTALMSQRRTGKPMTAAASFSDSFVDTPTINLSAHTPSVGTSWINRGGTFGTGTVVISTSGQASMTAANGLGYMFYQANPSPSSANCYAQSAMKHLANGLNTIVVRCVWNATAYMDDCYFLQCGGAAPTGEWSLQKLVGNARTSLANSTYSMAYGDTNTFKLTASGTTIKAFLNGAEIASVTDSSVSAAGDAGIYHHSGSGTGIDWMDYESSNL